jgi:hypothetical protein
VAARVQEKICSGVHRGALVFAPWVQVPPLAEPAPCMGFGYSYWTAPRPEPQVRFGFGAGSRGSGTGPRPLDAVYPFVWGGGSCGSESESLTSRLGFACAKIIIGAVGTSTSISCHINLRRSTDKSNLNNDTSPNIQREGQKWKN